ncbi:MAG: glycosyltransferase family 39 protein [Anaerolineae bacterium]|nr:glycosyltransferase family 39 protein [Anaerolineae bacterium]
MQPILDQRRLLLVWNVINIALLVYILNHVSAEPVVLGRYTRFYAIGATIAVLLAAAIAVFSLAPRLQEAVRQSMRGRLSLPALIAIVVANLALWLLPGDADQIKLIVGVNTFLLGLWLSGDRGRGRQNPAKAVTSVLIVVTVGLIILGFFSAYRTPPPHPGGDEEGWMNYAVTWLRTGQAYAQMMMVDPIPMTPGVGYWVVGLAGWLNLFGISFAALRALVWLVSAVIALTIGFVGARLYDRTTGAIAAVVAASSMLMLSSRLLRPELALTIPATLIILAYTRRRHPRWAFVCAILCVLTLEIHASGIAYIVGLGIAFIWDAARSLRRGEPFLRVSLIPFVVGGLVGGIVYLIAHVLILPEPGYYFENLRSGREFMTLINMAERWWSVLVDYWMAAPLELIAFALAIALIWRRNRGSDRTILSLFALTLLAYLLLVPYQQVYYIIFLPYVVLAIAALVRFGLDTLPTPDALHQLAAGVMLTALTMPFVATSLQNASLSDPYPGETFDGGELCLRRLSDPRAVVAGDTTAYWAFLDYSSFVSTIGEYELRKYKVLTSPLEPWDRARPDVVFYTDTPGSPELSPRIAAYIEQYRYDEVIRFLGDRFPVQVWLRPGYEPPEGRAQALAYCASVVEVLPAESP